jgi:hypothetical protein
MGRISAAPRMIAMIKISMLGTRRSQSIALIRL